VKLTVLLMDQIVDGKIMLLRQCRLDRRACATWRTSPTAGNDENACLMVRFPFDPLHRSLDPHGRGKARLLRRRLRPHRREDDGDAEWQVALREDVSNGGRGA